jgi:hypothetical protein
MMPNYEPDRTSDEPKESLGLFHGEVRRSSKEYVMIRMRKRHSKSRLVTRISRRFRRQLRHETLEGRNLLTAS